MFLINYAILEEEKIRLSSINHISEFENDINTVMGQFQIIFNDTVEGFVDKEIPYNGEFLIIWFKILNDALFHLSIGSFITVKKPDSCSIWFEFELKNNEVIVSQIRSEKQKYIKNFVENSPKKRNELLWCESISKDEFQKVITGTTSNFIRDILSMNELLSESYEFKELEKKYIKAKESCL